MEHFEEEIIANELLNNNDWNEISSHSLSNEFINNYHHKLNIYKVMENNIIDFDIIKQYINKHEIFAREMILTRYLTKQVVNLDDVQSICNLLSEFTWGVLCKYIKLTEEFVDKNINNIIFEKLYITNSYDYQFIEKYIYRYSTTTWSYISLQHLSLEFLDKYKQYLDWYKIIDYSYDYDINLLVEKYHDCFTQNVWKIIPWRQDKLDETLLLEFSSNIDLLEYFKRHEVSSRTIEQLLNYFHGRIYWNTIAEHQNLDLWFIKKYSRYLDYSTLNVNVYTRKKLHVCEGVKFRCR